MSNKPNNRIQSVRRYQAEEKTSDLCEIRSTKKSFNRVFLHYLYDIKESRFEMVSDTCFALLGFSSEKLKEMGMEGFIKGIHPYDIASINELYDSSEFASPILDSIEYRYKRDDGKVVKLQEQRCLIFSDDEKEFLLGMICGSVTL